jgi:polar amino acid transport system substrate-binding protein
MPSTTRSRLIRSSLAAASALSIALIAAGCSSPSSDASSTDAAGSSALAATDLTELLPADVVERGYITVAGDASYPPIGFIDEDGETMVGLDADMAAALGKALGVEFRKENASFDSIIPGIQGAKYDVGMSWINDTEVRREVVDFIDYSQDGSSMFGLAGLENAPESVADLCGRSVAVQKGTAQQTDVETASTDCAAAGSAAIDLQVYPDQTAANLAVNSGRAEISIADMPVAAWQVSQTDGAFALYGEPYGVVKHGVAVLKGSELAEPIARAFEAIMADGTYQQILDTWGMSAAALDAPLINGEPLS